MLAEELKKILLKRDWESLRKSVKEDRGIIRQLNKGIYIKEGIIFWRTVEAIGIAARELDYLRTGYSTELVRRYFWNLNEESGGTAWNASEVIGSIISHCPETCGHFNWMFSGLLEDQSLAEGVLWGLVQIVQNKPELVEPLEERIRPFLYEDCEYKQFLAILIYKLMASSEFRKEVNTLSDWNIPQDVVSGLISRQKTEGLEIYHNGIFIRVQSEDLLNPKLIQYCTVSLKVNDQEINVTVATSDRGLCWLGFGTEREEGLLLLNWMSRWFPNYFLSKNEKVNIQVVKALSDYLEGRLKEFVFPLDLRGTPFQIKVWEELRNIPYGTTRSYEEMANLVGSPQGQRAIGMANNKNPIGIIVPCHRVIGKNGSLTGYAGGLHIKEILLDLEKNNMN